MSLLVLSRKVGEQIQIGDDITITIVRLTNQGVRIGVDAPRDATITRSELLDALKAHDLLADEDVSSAARSDDGFEDPSSS